MDKKNYKVDVPVLIIFFARPELLKQVFSVVKKARPSKLYLYQDGPREDHQDDLNNILKCRSIVSKIDWECEVHTFYQTSNVGCDPSEYIAQKWMFETEDRGIILEDDDIPSQSFFEYCKELLERYKEDERIYSIAGMNHLGKYCEGYSDYIFTRNQSIWGWATWKRCIDLWDEKISFLDDTYTLKQMYEKLQGMKNTESTCRWHRSTGKEYYESIGWACQNTNNMLNIVPTRNMITNIGLGVNATHNHATKKELPKSVARVFNMKRYELKFPLRHPKFIVEDMVYLKKVNYIIGVGHPVVCFLRGMNIACRRFIYSDKKQKKEKLRRIPITLNTIFKRILR